MRTVVVKKPLPDAATLPLMRVLVRRFGGSWALMRDRLGWRPWQEWHRVLRLQNPLEDPAVRTAIWQTLGFDSRGLSQAVRDEAAFLEQRRAESEARYAPGRRAGYAAGVQRLKAEGVAAPLRWRR